MVPINYWYDGELKPTGTLHTHDHRACVVFWLIKLVLYCTYPGQGKVAIYELASLPYIAPLSLSMLRRNATCCRPLFLVQQLLYNQYIHTTYSTMPKQASYYAWDGSACIAGSHICFDRHHNIMNSLIAVEKFVMLVGANNNTYSTIETL